VLIEARPRFAAELARDDPVREQRDVGEERGAATLEVREDRPGRRRQIALDVGGRRAEEPAEVLAQRERERCGTRASRCATTIIVLSSPKELMS